MNAVRSTIIIPTRNRAGALQRTLHGLARQKLESGAFEILVIDNGSTDSTRETVVAATVCYGEVIRYVYESEPGLLAARHCGAREAWGEILTFVDDDIDTEPDWLSAILARFNRPDIHLVGGPSLPLYESAPPDWLEAFWFTEGSAQLCGHLSLIDDGVMPHEIHPCRVWGLNYSIRKVTLQRVGGFNPDTFPKALQKFQGDGESGLSRKLRQLKLKAWYEPRAKVIHRTPMERLTIEFFEARGYFQGVCDSYRDLRNTIWPINESEKRPSTTARVLESLRYRFGRAFGRKASVRPSQKFHRERQRVQEAYCEGYAFHQRAVREDPALLDWICRKDYWDYRLPTTSPELDSVRNSY